MREIKWEGWAGIHLQETTGLKIWQQQLVASCSGVLSLPIDSWIPSRQEVVWAAPRLRIYCLSAELSQVHILDPTVSLANLHETFLKKEHLIQMPSNCSYFYCCNCLVVPSAKGIRSNRNWESAQSIIFFSFCLLIFFFLSATITSAFYIIAVQGSLVINAGEWFFFSPLKSDLFGK